MEKIILTGIIVVSFFAGSAFPGERLTGSAPAEIPTNPAEEKEFPYQEATITGASPKRSNVYWNALREIEREYQEGSLTKTEYIQRKRELDEMDY